MKDTIASKRYLVAGYGLPAEFGVVTLFGMGVPPEQIAILTHPTDTRNAGLHSIASLRNIALSELPAKWPATVEWVEAFRPDVLLSLHYRNLIPKQILDAASLGGVNLHPSLLPKYRGTNSVAWVLINGESETGFTFHRMDEKFDTGAIILQEKIEITAHDTAFSLFHRQIGRAMARLETVIERVLSNEPGQAQVGEGSYFRRALPFDGMIEPTWPIDRIERFIRAMYFPPFEPAKLVLDGCTYSVPTMECYAELMRTSEHAR